MRFCGFLITRLKGIRIGDHESAIIDLQERVDTLEKHRVVKVKEAQQEDATQSEIDKILAAGSSRTEPDLWRIE